MQNIYDSQTQNVINLELLAVLFFRNPVLSLSIFFFTRLGVRHQNYIKRIIIRYITYLHVF